MVTCPASVSEAISDSPRRRLVPFGRVRPRCLLRALPGRGCAAEDERRDTVGISRGEKAGKRTAVSCRKNDGSLTAGCIQYGQHVPEEVLERRRISGSEALRAAESAPIGHDNARDPRELPQKLRHRRVIRVELDVREIALEVEQARFGALEHPIREPSVTTSLIGAALGLPFGILLSALLAEALSQYDVRFTVPVMPLVVFARWWQLSPACSRPFCPQGGRPASTSWMRFSRSRCSASWRSSTRGSGDPAHAHTCR